MTGFRAASIILGGAVLGLAVAAPPARAEAESVTVAPEPVVVSPDEMSRTVTVRDVQVNGDEVSGTVVNNSGHPVRDVQLLVKYVWLWKNERKPGNDNPGRAEFETIPGELPPGATKQFTYRPDPPLEHRKDGRFEPSVDVAGAVEVTPTDERRGSL
jgi:hypothetical protein